MPGRALIIGIEQYPQAVDLAQTIAGATASAEQFFDWVTTTKHIAASDAYVCAGGGTFTGANRFSTDRERIVDAIAALTAAGQDQTDELYVFFSGHGYGFKESFERRAVDVLIAGDFQSAANSGTKCLKLQEIQEKLYAILGGLHHYYFIDACRTLVEDDEIDPIGLGRMLGRPAQRGRPTKYTLYSTAYGTTAAINSGFAPALVDGLHGKGTAKGFTPNGSMFVMFPLLCNYIQSRIRNQKLDQSQDGNGTGYIVELIPVPTYTCTITIADAAPGDALTATISVAGNPLMASRQNFSGGTCALPFTPGNLVLDVQSAGRPLTRIDPPAGAAMSFWDDCAATFRLQDPPGAGAAAPPSAPLLEPLPSRSVTLSMSGLPDVHAQATNLNTGETHEFAANDTHAMAPGEYEVTINERGVPISRTTTTFAPGTARRLGAVALDPVRVSIVQAVGGDPARGVVAFSETLGDIANQDLGLWLTIMGASHIVADPSTFSKLKNLPLDSITPMTPGSSGVYLLGVSAGGDMPRVTVDDVPANVHAVPTLTGVFHSLIPSAAGPKMVTITSGKTSRTFASACLPNRLTLFVCSPGARGQMRVNQFMLPMFHLYNSLDPAVAALVSQHTAPLRVVRSAFASKRAITTPTQEEQQLWGELLLGKWIDPIMGLLACYEILRRGDDAAKATIRAVVIPSMDQFFPGIADIAAIAEMLQGGRTMPAGPPLFREGLIAFPDWENHLPLTADRLDFNHIWTAWRV